MISAVLGTRRLGTAMVLGFALLLGACNGDAPAADGGAGQGSALSGGMNEKRGGIRGNVGLGNIEVRLLEVRDDVCQEEGDPLLTTMSDEQGEYAFVDLDTSLGYCIGYEGNTLSCDCDWSEVDCTCSDPGAGPSGG